MWNLQDDKELDNLSREAADNYPLDQQAGSWNKLQLKLDAEMPKEKRRRYLLLLLLFLFVGSGIFWLNRMNMEDSDHKYRLAQTNQQADQKKPQVENRKTIKQEVVGKEQELSNKNKI